MINKINIKKFFKYLFLGILILVTSSVLSLNKLAPTLLLFIPEELRSVFIKLIIAILVFAVLKIIFDSLERIIVNNMEKKKVSEQEIFFMGSLFRIIFWIFITFVFLGVFFESMTSLITALGLIGAGLAVALQHPLLNIIGWMIILFNKTFTVGDRIEVENVNFDIRGDVVDITPMYTKIRKLGKNDEKTGKITAVPNEILIMNSINNYAKGTGFIWDRMRFSITYESNIKRAKEIILNATEETLSQYNKLEAKEKRKYTSEKVPDKPSVWINLQESSIIEGVTYLVNTKNKLNAQAEISEAVYNAIKKEKDVEFAYPHVQIVEGKK